MTPQTLRLLPTVLAVCRLPVTAPLPEWASASPFCSITRTPEELSVVCTQADVPRSVRHEPDWRCLQVQGPLPFSLIGVLADLSATLARAGIPIFVLSTFDTDYLLVKQETLPQTLAALRQEGHHILE